MHTKWTIHTTRIKSKLPQAAPSQPRAWDWDSHPGAPQPWRHQCLPECYPTTSTHQTGHWTKLCGMHCIWHSRWLTQAARGYPKTAQATSPTQLAPSTGNGRGRPNVARPHSLLNGWHQH